MRMPCCALGRYKVFIGLVVVVHCALRVGFFADEVSGCQLLATHSSHPVLSPDVVTMYLPFSPPFILAVCR